MTVSQAIITWLLTFGDIGIDDIDTDLLQANSAAAGLYKAPSTTVVPFVDGSRDITAYYTFCARQRSNEEAKRQDNQEWLEALEVWIYQQNRSKNLPTMGTSRKCNGVMVANTFTMQDEEVDQSVYQLTLAIAYTEAA